MVPDAKASLEIMALFAFPRVCQSLGCPPLQIGVSHGKGPPLHFFMTKKLQGGAKGRDYLCSKVESKQSKRLLSPSKYKEKVPTNYS